MCAVGISFSPIAGHAAMAISPDRPSNMLSSLSSGSSTALSEGSSGADEPLVTREQPATKPAIVQIGADAEHTPSNDEQWILDNRPGVEFAVAHSPAMKMDVNMLIARPKDEALREGAPTIYLLNGLDGGTGWFLHTDAVDFYTSRGVNVVMITSGAFSYYTNWIQGNGQWDTFLARELPAGIEPILGANGRRAVMGVSMSATSALGLAQNNPGVYDGVASISGCASTTSPLGKIAADQVFMSAPEPLTYEDVWGDPSGDYARYYDPMLNLNKLSDEFQGKDLEIFISSTSGLAGLESLTTGNIVDPGNVDLAMNFVTIGGRIDVAANACTHVLHQRMLLRGIDHDARFYPQGTHNWNSFRWAVPDSWPTLSRALGLPAT